MRRSASLLAFVLAVVVGTITDRTTGQPMGGVTVRVGSARTTSRDDGSYRLSGVGAGSVSLTVSSDDVPPQHFPIALSAGTTRADLRVCSITLDYSCGGQQ